MSAGVTPEVVLAFWLGAPGDPPLAKAESWWKKDEAFDREIEARFGETLEAGVRGELSAWRETPRGRLALVVLFDQLSRNMFRGTPRAFAQDALAREIAAAALAAGDDQTLSTMETSFLLMPFMHSEELAEQERCVAGFEGLLRSCAPELRPTLESSLDFARKHRDIVARFGRFPHRNAILGRASTPGESAFLTQPGSSF